MRELSAGAQGHRCNAQPRRQSRRALDDQRSQGALHGLNPDANRYTPNPSQGVLHAAALHARRVQQWPRRAPHAVRKRADAAQVGRGR